MMETNNLPTQRWAMNVCGRTGVQRVIGGCSVRIECGRCCGESAIDVISLVVMSGERPRPWRGLAE